MSLQDINQKDGGLIKRIRTIYFALVGIIVLLSVVSFLLVQYRVMGSENNTMAMEWLRILLLVIPMSMATGYFIFRVKLKRVKQGDLMESKLQQYFTAALLRMIFFGIPGFLLSLAALTSAQFLFLAIVPLILLVFLLTRPFPQTIADELNLSSDERFMLEKVKI